MTPHPVILDTPVIPAEGWDDWGVGNPEEQRAQSCYYWCW